jgi:hypothetical protein
LPNEDKYHGTVIQALIADGWSIIKEHALLSSGTRRLFVDLHAKRLDSDAAALFEVKGFESPVDALAET